MTATSADNDKPVEPVAPQETEAQAKVPVAAIAKERADKREARAEVERLKEQLAQAQQRKDSEMQELIESMGPHIAEMVSKAAEAAVKPLKDEAAFLKTAVSLGLNEEQANELAKLKAETPGLTNERALAILRVENPTLFGARNDGRPVTAFSPSGDSPFRSQAPTVNYMEKMAEAVKNKDQKATMQFATMELFRRVNDARGKPRG